MPLRKLNKLLQMQNNTLRSIYDKIVDEVNGEICLKVAESVAGVV